ncbi:Hypothetical protein PFR_JS20-2_529 [Propionibacterium freudenreichii]|nr:Hypothetical protein PFR_JS20-1_529 [Propionibacterium freudenreichii]SCQ80052.1 Hypothetical protein PFR_JS20-2_529 [Propionibacterium freudenreichii]
MTRAHRPVLRSAADGARVPGAPLWAPQVMRPLRSRMTTDNGPHRGQATQRRHAARDAHPIRLEGEKR